MEKYFHYIKVQIFVRIIRGMTSISFTEPSVGEVNDDKVALEIRNNGNGGGVVGTSKKGKGVFGTSETDDGVRGESLNGVGVVGIGKEIASIGVFGQSQHAEAGTGVVGTSKKGKGVFGTSETDDGVLGEGGSAGAGVVGVSKSARAGVVGQNDIGATGVSGISRGSGVAGIAIGPVTTGIGTGVHGQADTGTGVIGLGTGIGAKGVWGETTHAEGGAGVIGKSIPSIGVHGLSKTSIGVQGESERGDGVRGVGGIAGSGVVGVSTSGRAAVVGQNKATDVIGQGVNGTSRGIGVAGFAIGDPTTGVATGTGVYGTSGSGTGVIGETAKGIGVKGIGTAPNSTGVWGENPRGNGIGVVGISKVNGIGVFGQGAIAGQFIGRVEITGDVKITGTLNGHAADCAEDFDIDDSENAEPGTVMVFNKTGSLRPSCQEYDKRVAGIISGAGGYKPAIVLDRQQTLDQDKRNSKSNKNRLPVALMGKVYCKVDARHLAIEIGDLLTTSSSKGYAMKAKDPAKAFGAVIGKALGSIKEGLGMIPVLVTLQ